MFPLKKIVTQRNYDAKHNLLNTTLRLSPV